MDHVGVMAAVLVAACVAAMSATYLRALYLAALVYLTVRLSLVVIGIVPNMSGGAAFELQWLAELLGQLTFVWLVASVGYWISGRWRRRGKEGPST